MSLKSWKNGDRAEVVKSVIESNFATLLEKILKLEKNPSKTYVSEFSDSNWMGKQIVIPYSTHQIGNPTATLYRLSNGVYDEVLGGVSIRSDSGVILAADIPFSGKVVIK